MQSESGVGRRRHVGRRTVLVAAGSLLGGSGALLAGCSAGAPPQPPPVTPTAAVSIPAGGVTLAKLGFSHGPVGQWSLPASVTLGRRIDQPNQLTFEVLSPPPAEVLAYLVDALPRAGFTVTGVRLEAPGHALLATGHGWRGSVVAVEPPAGAPSTMVTLQQLD
ncbi:hypothetical protein ACQBAU_14360 [Propionibacteriaceae bacterium Y2011]|uniref:hypothetical protein n=1 Tax=Microlunatus sp. Y2014 TaxID=3418488 RepID=UPI003B46960D